MKTNTRSISTMWIVSVAYLLSYPAFVGCAKGVPDSDLQVSSGLSIGEIRELIASVTTSIQDEGKYKDEQAYAR